MGDVAKSRRPEGPSSGNAVGQVTIVCVPGAGGPRLADELRRVGCAGSTAVEVIMVTPPEESAPVFIGDPLSGVFWPLGTDDAANGAFNPNAVRRRARQLQWFLWELGIDAQTEVRRGDPAVIVAGAARRPGVDAVVFAAPTGWRWRGTVRRAGRQGGPRGATISSAFDPRIGPLGRVCAGLL